MSDQKVAVLRQFEPECYGVCLYMLKEEKSAAQAAQAALTEVYRDTEFWRLPTEDRERRICRIAISKALERRGQQSGGIEKDFCAPGAEVS